jgi:hypothetical protein
MTQASRVLDFLWSVAPDGATNSQIAERTGISSHQTVYMLTQELVRRRLIRGERDGRTWKFYAEERDAETLPLLSSVDAAPSRASEPAGLTPWQFEELARRVLSERYGVELAPGTLPGVRKRFDLVSPDQQVVGDTRYYARVRGVALPPAKFWAISEQVWLLEKTGAPIQILVFGNDRAVPSLWLERFGDLAPGVAFFFLRADGTLEMLSSPSEPPAP